MEIKSYSSSYPIWAQKTSFPELSKVSFGHKLISDRADLDVAKGLKKLKNYSIAEYKTLSEKEKQALRDEYRNYCEKYYRYPFKVETLHDAASYYIKSHLDKKYGEGKYAVITIGRSLSSIGKVLGYKIGEENVLNIPMSKAMQYLNSAHISKLKQDGTIDKFRKYLATQGLEKNKIGSSKKHYIIMDYTYSGKSLKGAQQLLTRNDLLGNKNISAISIDQCMPDNYVHKYIDLSLMPKDYKKYSFVDYAPNLSDVPSATVDTQKADYSAQLLWFKLLDNQIIKPKEVSFQPPKTTFLEKLKCWFSKADLHSDL